MKQALISFGIALVLSTVFTALLIPFLKKNHIGQNIRETGPKHQKKAGTPTMGGMAFVPAIILGAVPFIAEHPEMIPILIMTVGYGLIGMLDDGLKKKHGVNEGLKAKLTHMPFDARQKLQQTLEKVINEGCSGLICIII